jgi:hypothetical protein
MQFFIKWHINKRYSTQTHKLVSVILDRNWITAMVTSFSLEVFTPELRISSLCYCITKFAAANSTDYFWNAWSARYCNFILFLLSCVMFIRIFLNTLRRNFMKSAIFVCIYKTVTGNLLCFEAFALCYMWRPVVWCEEGGLSLLS